MKEWKKTILIAVISALIGGSGSTILLESYYRPRQLRTEIQSQIYMQTYDKRVQLYQSLIEMFSSVYWLERALADEPSKAIRKKRRLELIQHIQREITRSSVITQYKIFKLSFDALNFYIVNEHQFTPDIRKKWIDNHFNPLLNAIRADLHQDEVRESLSHTIFSESTDSPQKQPQ